MKIKLKKSYIIVAFVTIFILLFPILKPTMAVNETVINEPITTPKAAIGPPYKAALMIGGDETDLGFSYVAIEAMEYLNTTYGWEISISRQIAYPDQYGVASQYGADGYDVVFCVGGQFIDTTYFAGVAETYNDTLWVQIPGLNEYVPAPDNVVGLHPSFQTEGHYLAGVLAGAMSETNRLGVVFGEWYEYLAMEFYAFEAGAKSVYNDTLVYARVAGTWGDAYIGKQITTSLINTKNVDFVVQVADTTGRGVISACQELNKTVIGTVADQAVLAPDHMITSIGMNTTWMMELVVQYIENGTAMAELGGLSWRLPIGNYLYPYHHFDSIIPQSVKDLVEDTKEGIANGSIVVPQTSTDDPPADPFDPLLPVDPKIPGFPYWSLVLATILGVMGLLVIKRKKIHT